jgi:hypothetical protein
MGVRFPTQRSGSSPLGAKGIALLNTSHEVRDAAPPNETVVDGEVVALDAAERPSLNALQNGMAWIFFYAFDVLIVAGRGSPSLGNTPQALWSTGTPRDPIHQQKCTGEKRKNAIQGIAHRMGMPINRQKDVYAEAHCREGHKGA